jgi:hypothetical protein
MRINPKKVIMMPVLKNISRRRGLLLLRNRNNHCKTAKPLKIPKSIIGKDRNTFDKLLG